MFCPNKISFNNFCIIGFIAFNADFFSLDFRENDLSLKKLEVVRSICATPETKKEKKNRKQFSKLYMAPSPVNQIYMINCFFSLTYYFNLEYFQTFEKFSKLTQIHKKDSTLKCSDYRTTSPLKESRLTGFTDSWKKMNLFNLFNLGSDKNTEPHMD